jgi:hypothetical protein
MTEAGLHAVLWQFYFLWMSCRFQSEEHMAEQGCTPGQAKPKSSLRVRHSWMTS